MRRQLINPAFCSGRPISNLRFAETGYSITSSRGPTKWLIRRAFFKLIPL